MVKLLNANEISVQKTPTTPLSKSRTYTQSLHCGRVSNACVRHLPQDIQGIFAPWTGPVSPESVEEWHSTPVAGTGRAGPRWLEEDGCPRVGLHFLGGTSINVPRIQIPASINPVPENRNRKKKHTLLAAVEIRTDMICTNNWNYAP